MGAASIIPLETSEYNGAIVAMRFIAAVIAIVLSTIVEARMKQREYYKATRHTIEGFFRSSRFQSQSADEKGMYEFLDEPLL